LRDYQYKYASCLEDYLYISDVGRPFRVYGGIYSCGVCGGSDSRKMMLESQSHKVIKSQDKCKIKNLVFIFLTCVLCLVTCGLFAQTISSTDLINNAKQYDGKVVVYAGEVIGDVMARQDHAWINVHDGNNAIGIWLSKDLTRDIRYTGSYKAKGDWVEVTGVFQRACPQHGGDLDIHAQKIRTIKSGSVVPEELDFNKGYIVVVLSACLLLIWILTLLKHK
jgi:RecJ-like exonuclease